MKVVFISNFMNHHQIGLCDELSNLLGENNFWFVAQEKTPAEQSRLGYLEYNSSREYIVKEYEQGINRTNLLIDDADIIIISFSQGVKPIRKAQRQQKIIFWYDESLFKEYSKIRILAKMLRAKYYFDFIRNENQYFLNASSYGYHDLCLLNKEKYKDKSFLFGYFPVFDFNEKILRKHASPFSVLFVGRLITWKHPEYVFFCAEVLEENGINYHIDIVGDGPLKEHLQHEIDKRKLAKKITLIGPVSSDRVKEFYLTHDVFLFASDRKEGWGAVLSEAMLYGCVPLANNDAGATNVFIKNGVNGYIFKDKDSMKRYCMELCMLKNEHKLDEIANINRELILTTWNYKEAARRLFSVMQAVHSKVDYLLYKRNELMGVQ